MTNLLAYAAFGYSAVDPNAVWTDITPWVDVVSSGVSISRGASDEVSQIQPGTLSLVLDNADGRFTPGRATSPYYPNVRRRTPIRVAVAVLDTPSGAAPYPLAKLADNFDDGIINLSLWSNNFGGVETGGRARVPCTAGVFAGFQSSRSWTLAGSWTTVMVPTIPAASTGTDVTASVWVNSTTAGTRCGFVINPVTGTLRCENDTSFSDGGATSLTYSPTAHLWLRLREASGTLYWETSPDGVTWTVRRSLATPAWVTSQQVTLSLESHRDAGTADFAEFDLVGATVHPRFYGTVTSWPVGWSGLQSKAVITASDLFAWLSRQPALQPMLVEEVLQDAPVAYYPLSEPQGSTSGGDISGYTRPSLATVQAGTGGTLTFSDGTGPPSDNLRAPFFSPASASAGLYLSTDLNTRLTTESTGGTYVFEVWFAAATTGRVIMSWATSDPPAFENSITFLLDAATGHLQIEKRTAGTLATTTLATANLSDGVAHHLVFDEASATVYLDGAAYSVSIGPSTELRLLTVGAYQAGRLWAGTISHVAIYVNTGSGPTGASVAGHYTTGMTGNSGESADARIARLAGYAGVTSVLTAGTFSGVGSQGELGSTSLSHMQDVERTESGKLFCDRGAPAVVFQGRTVRYNPVSALTLAYADLETDGLGFADDDQKMVNIVVASRPGGATQRVVNQASVDAYGPYEQPLDILKTSDAQVLDAANWMVIRYADPQPELRQLPVEAYTMPAATYRALLAADISTVFTAAALPDQAPAATATVVVEGYTETITQARHLIDFHTSRADTDAVWTLDDPVYSLLGSTTRLAY